MCGQLFRDAGKVWCHIGIKKPEVASRPVGVEFVYDDSFAFKHFPTLWEWLTATVYEGGEGERQTTTITIFCEEGKVKASVNARDIERVAFVTADSFLGLLEAINRKLQDGSLDWREPAWKARRGRK